MDSDDSCYKKMIIRYKKINSRKNKILRRIKNRIKEILHKQTAKLVSMLKKEDVKTVATGDVRNLRQNVNYGKTANQRTHQMMSGKVNFMLTYKAINEAYSSQTCPDI